ncbi:MAG TPA: hypothetical protein VNX68_12835 [Nitrosopumilaceae archaeon]|jgi:hypothetical protein|nr:hypothetical protein [Nitrosopumilaceae archaeon]
MKNKSELTICVYDLRGGSYLNVAMLLYPYFRETYYYSESRDAFPQLALASIGTGFDEDFTRVTDFWKELSNFDIIIFPDGNCADLGQHLRSMGKMVFGGSNMENIESSRSQFNELLDRVGLPVPKSIVVKGLKNLIKYIKGKKQKYIKVSKWRNLIETYFWVDYTSSKFWLDELTHKLGPLSESDQLEFIIQDPIDAIAELGSDGYTLNGQTPETLIWGLECKDVGYIGKISQKTEIPEPISYVNDKFRPILKAFGANGFYSTEIRYTENKTPYYTDIAARAGMPPSSSYLKNINNWNEIIPGICKGVWVEPTYDSIYMIEIILKSNYCKEGYLPVTFPNEFKDNITFKGAMKAADKIFIIPFSFANIDMVEFGSVVVNGDNLEQIIAQAMEICASIQAYELRYEISAPDLIKEDIFRLETALNLKF